MAAALSRPLAALMAVAMACCPRAALASPQGLRGAAAAPPAGPTAIERPPASAGAGNLPSEFAERGLQQPDDSAEDWDNLTDVADSASLVELGEMPAEAEGLGVAANASQVHAASAWGWGRRNIKTLYHTTSPEIASLILRTGFKPGHSGWCGGAIYFTDIPYLPRSKFGPATKTGAIIQAEVDLGRMAYMDRHCHSSRGSGVAAMSRAGYDSLCFNPGDGSEYVVLSPRRDLSTRLYK